MSVAPSGEAGGDAVTLRLFVGGEWREASGGGTFAVEDPATGEVLSRGPARPPEDAVAALAAAVAAQADWAAYPPRDRGEVLRRAFEALSDRADELALLMTLEMGKPLAESHGEI